jgi:hypothetical protein
MTGTLECAAKRSTIVVIEGADHDHVDHAREHPRAVFDRFATAELGIARRQEHGVAAELGHAGLERDAGARRDLAKIMASTRPGNCGVVIARAVRMRLSSLARSISRPARLGAAGRAGSGSAGLGRHRLSVPRADGSGG